MTDYEKGLARLDNSGKVLYNFCHEEIIKIDEKIVKEIQDASCVYKINNTRFCDLHPGSSQPKAGREKAKSLVIDINTFGQQVDFEHPLVYRKTPKPYSITTEYIRYNVSTQKEFESLAPLLEKAYKLALDLEQKSKGIIIHEKANQEQRAYLAWEHLTKIAAKKKRTRYTELAAAAGVSHPRPTRFFLDLIQDYCLESKLPPLTILVVNQSGKPGGGFMAWDINNFQEGFDSVYRYNWDVIANPFSYAAEGLTKEKVIKQLLEVPDRSHEVYSIIRSRGVAQSIFRDAILKIYDKRCAICGFGIRNTLDASHIVAWKDCSKEEKMDVCNGILLCATHHKLFDYGYITINDNFTINYYDPKLKKRSYLEHEKIMTIAFHGKKIRLPEKASHCPKGEYLKRHRQSF